MLRMLVLLMLLTPAARADWGFWEEASARPGEVSPTSLYEDVPDIAGCREGVVRRDDVARVLRFVNELRALHGLAPVTYDAFAQVLPAKASLMMVANNLMTHTPDRHSKCGSGEGVKGSGESNLYTGSVGPLTPSSETLVAGWIKDVAVPELGHRRWLLDPFLGPIAFGRVDDVKLGRYGAALRVFGVRDEPPPKVPDFVAYPYGRYPAMLFDPRAEWSISLADGAASRQEARYAFFAGAAVTVKDEADGRLLDVSRLTRDSKGIGLPNILSWRVGGAQIGGRYSVTIENLQRVGDRPTTLSYSVRIEAPSMKKAIEAGGAAWERKSASNGKDTFTFGDAKRYCATVGGHVPTDKELTSIVLKGPEFAIDSDRFPNISPYANYWTSTTWQPGKSPFLNVVAFWDHGKVYQQDPGEPAGVICALDRPPR